MSKVTLDDLRADYEAALATYDGGGTLRCATDANLSIEYMGGNVFAHCSLDQLASGKVTIWFSAGVPNPVDHSREVLVPENIRVAAKLYGIANLYDDEEEGLKQAMMWKLSN
ncbi:hypothetical protein [Sphingobium sp. LSP13-1-1.1]|uniref:hypothetical protein n=1 Tax=Sphingobium sp. LSP13-1-1.1 TaxID=3135234 RepID=UPI00341C88D7